MQPIQKIPTYSICNLLGADKCMTDIIVMRLSDYMYAQKDIKFPHRHDFYQIVLFTQGDGSHSIDFTQYQVSPHQVYYMNPGQMHTWEFGPDVDGYIINFRETLFTAICHDPNFLKSFPIFALTTSDAPVNTLDLACCTDLEQTFAQLLVEFKAEAPYKLDLLRGLLMVILVKLSRAVPKIAQESNIKHHLHIVRDFERLIDLHYQDKRLPKEYAEMLFISPNYLNSLTTSVIGKKAGEMIRDRILLEAKRMLVNSDFLISQIADHLNFEDNAYFTRFFKKYTGVTPEQFRISYVKDHSAQLQSAHKSFKIKDIRED